MALTDLHRNHPLGRAIAAHHIQPGTPQQRTYIEGYHRSNRTEVLDTYLFTTLQDACYLPAAKLLSITTWRLHDSLGRAPPLYFFQRPTVTPMSLILSTHRAS